MPNIHKNELALAGEFLVLAHLSSKGYVATLTLGHTKSIDILLTNQETGKLFKVEVKTTSNGTTGSRHFGNNIEWMMDMKHEKIDDKNLFYCFVQLEGGKLDKPRFFIVPSNKVAKFVKDDDAYYNRLPHRRPVKQTAMRLFKIGIDDNSRGLPANNYENKWDYFDR